MRFHEDGPNIPNELISAQRRGEVVFFCGAGVSVPAKLPSFLELARDVMKRFGVSMASNVILGTQLQQIEEAINAPRHKKNNLPFSLDQTFYLLQQEYGKSAVAKEVLSAVKIPKRAPVDNHQSILHLSRNRDGNPQVVTTNFDLLFQQADSRVKSYVPPTLPSLTNGEQINGVVYLHGKWNDPAKSSRDASNLVISSADFGRAYLADGWASAFIKDLAQQYVIVLLGYSAEDPPVRYLLEGLHSRGAIAEPRIYSFERGTAEEVRHNWQHRGVNGIAFETFPALWTSLKTWATYSEEPKYWQRNVIDMAQQRPVVLKPYQRGQVAFTISTVEGAKMFSEKTPPPPAEWLCVFDSEIRNRKPVKKSFLFDSATYSYQDNYALDDDVYRAEDSDEYETYGNDYLSDLPGDERRQFSNGLAKSHTSLPVRLQYLAVWFIQVLDQPISLWWLAGKTTQSPQLKEMIANRLRRPESSKNKQLDAWWSYLEQIEGKLVNFDTRLFKFNEAVKVQGWNSRMIQNFEEALKPVFEVTRHSNVPPTDENKVVDIEIRLPTMSGLEINVPEENLADAIRAYRSCIEKYIALTKSENIRIYSDFLADDAHQMKPDLFSYIEWFKELYTKLAQYMPEDARSEINSWSLTDPIFFAPLRVHAWRHQKIWEPQTVIEGITNLPGEFFWKNEKYLAPLVGTYWPYVSNEEKNRLLDFIRNGPDEDIDQTPERIFLNEALFSAPFLLAMQEAGCEMDESCQKLIHRAQNHEYWNSPSERNFSSSARVIRKTIDTTPDALLNASISEIVQITENLKNRTHLGLNIYKPFEGLVKSNAIRAYRALVYALKNKKYPITLWRDLLTSIPEDTSKRLWFCIIEQIFRMPRQVFIDLQHPITIFLEKKLPIIAVSDSLKATAIWDQAFDCIATMRNEKIEESQEKSYYSSEYLDGSPLGNMLKLLIHLYNDKNLPKCNIQKKELRTRLDKALTASTESRKLLINIGITDLHWFNELFPKWTKDNLIAKLLSDNIDYEAAWNGFIYLRFGMPKKLFYMIKHEFMNLFGQFSMWPWGKDLSRNLHSHFLYYCTESTQRGKYLTEAEAREILQRTNDDGRVYVLNHLSNTKNWKSFQRNFLKNIWPRELRYMNSRTSSALIRIAVKNEDDFPDAVSTVLPFITYVTHAEHSFYSLNGAYKRMAKYHPSEMLSLIDAAIGEKTMASTSQIDSILNEIVKACPRFEYDKRMRRLREHLDHNPF